MIKKPLTTIKQQGFTLVELSIVIIIIGLLIAGVTAGQSLIKLVRLNATVTEFKKYELAFYVFTETYRYIPGDMPTASAFWPEAIDGDGNGIINATEIASPEVIESWQHLSLSGMITGNYSGTGTPTIGTNIPKSSYSATVGYWPSSDNMWNNYSSTDTHLILSGVGWWGWIDYQISVQDAYAMDLKFDDGLPFTGQLIGWNSAFAWPTPPVPCNNLDIESTSGAPFSSTQRYMPENTAKCSLRWGLYNYTFRGNGL